MKLLQFKEKWIQSSPIAAVKNARFNPYQGHDMRVLCVCSVGLLRSPTLAKILSADPWNFNTRSCGIEKDNALIPISEALINWSNIILTMTIDEWRLLKDTIPNKTIECLNIQDDYGYCDPEMIRQMKRSVEEIFQ